MFVFVNFLFSKFWFHYFKFWCSIKHLGNINWEVLLLAKLGKTVFTVEFLTVANTPNTKIKNIEDKVPDITNLATNASLHAKINEVKSGTSSITNLDTNSSLNAKINEVKGEIPNITNLPSTTALTAVENKIPNVSNLAKKN